jgi:DNA-damage-inducible protein J
MPNVLRDDHKFGLSGALAREGEARYNVTHYLEDFTMTTTAMVHVRVDEQIKAQATEALAAMGLSVSDAVRVFLMRVVAEQQMPFALKVPNAKTRTAMKEANQIALSRRARFGTAAELFDDLEKNSRK